ncbi:alpha-L-glutamate ligase-like protein [Desulfobaculum bizertense]|uniref:Alpha-L-glutamate ligase-related protein n=1 Tax=Desulfobaculum bizertense DSM 18034 TaxID=1121442 RepID=A0A1T4VZA6_9BACT|nr:alpha-L-glutamate ligase-like protein [Desulfobaculum bizertense]UIJ37032.1 alpha-L-glutamate ligase-like protein [Desulfobaculum bizertense]SKA70354.1 alpha-L-glutamate ligase-related protein [Desulfobaculum bizertense DSM 18034]
MLLNPFAKLKRAGVVGMNSRNAEFVLPNNDRRKYPLVDDKLKTKELAQGVGLKVPELYGVIRAPHEVKKLPKILEGHDSFVIKPACGSGGNGILVVARKIGPNYHKPDDSIILMDEISFHVSNILSGMHSLGGNPDKAVIEYCVQFDPIFKDIAYQGVPDIRIIVYKGIPAMAMLRLPTRESDGKANLHQGAMGCGIDIPTGLTTNAVWKNSSITLHPDTQKPISGVQIPGWHDLLRQASLGYSVTGLGYLGVDFVLDKYQGPLMLELNARPGLAIQVANLRGLHPRLERIDAVHESLKTEEERVEFAMETFHS